MQMGEVMLLTVFCLITNQASFAGPRPISTDGTDPATWDSKTDGPIAASGNHKVLYEDDNVRVMSVTVPAGTKEPFHSHLRCSVLVYDSPGKSIDYDSKGNVASRVTLAAIPWLGDQTPKSPPLVFVQPPQSLHSIVNRDTKSLHLTRIELKKGCEAPPK